MQLDQKVMTATDTYKLYKMTPTIKILQTSLKEGGQKLHAHRCKPLII